jgi:hypothetical protein
MATRTNSTQARAQQGRPQQYQQRQAPPPAAAEAAVPLEPPANFADVEHAIEKAIADCGVLAVANLSQMQQAMRMAQGINALKLALTNDFLQRVIMPLQSTALGFLTDKDKEGGYPIDVVRTCCVDAMLRGFRVVGNEFNIISGRFYGAKAGFERQVTEFPGLTDLVMEPGVPAMRDGGAVVPFVASWKLNGNPMQIACLPAAAAGQLDSRIPVKVNAGMGADAVIGKAYRKMYFRIWQRLHGSTFGMVDGDAHDGEVINTTGTPAPAAGAPKVDPLAAMGQAHRAKKEQAAAAPADAPPPANDAGPPTIQMVIDALVDADEAWSLLTTAAATAVVEAWTGDQRRAAYAWAMAFVQTPDDQGPPEQPEFTLLPVEDVREPGEEG